MHSLSPDLAKQHIALLLEEAEGHRLASQARAASRRRRQRHRMRRTVLGAFQKRTTRRPPSGPVHSTV
jgi:hypothetical protein